MLSASTVALQALLFGEAPIHFAPSLAALCLVTLYCGYEAGLAALGTSALLIHFFLLRPAWGWSSNPRAVGALGVYLVVSVVLVAAAETLRRRLARLVRALEDACQVSESRTRLHTLEVLESQKHIAKIQERYEKTLEVIESATNISRYADSLMKRLSVITAAVVDLSDTPGLGEDENGESAIPVIHRQVIDLVRCLRSRDSSLHQAMDVLVDSDGATIPTARHPLMRAVRGDIIYGQHVGWRSSSGELRDVRLFAAVFANGRFLALVIAAPTSVCETYPDSI